MSRTKSFAQWKPKYQAILDERSLYNKRRQEERYASELATGPTPMHKFARYGQSGYATDEGDDEPENLDQQQQFDYADEGVIRDAPIRQQPWRMYAQQDEELFYLDELRGLPPAQRPYDTYKEEYMDVHYPVTSRREYSKPFKQRLKARRPGRTPFGGVRGRRMGAYARTGRLPSRHGGGWRRF